MTIGAGSPTLSIGEIIGFAYRSLYAAFLAMPMLFAGAFAVSVLRIGIELVIIVSADGRGVAAELVDFALTVVWAFLFTPYLIAVARFILLDESVDGYPFAVRKPRFFQFFATLLVLRVMLLVIFLFLFAFAEWAGFGLVLGGLMLLVLFGLVIAFVAFALKLSVLFPAIAVDAPGARWENALADTRGHGWQFFLIFVFALLAPVVFALVLTLIGLYPATGGPLSIATVFAIAVEAAFRVAVSGLLIAVAARLYQLLGDRLNE